MKTTIKFLKTGKITTELKEEMWSIYEKYYSYEKDYFFHRMMNNTHFAFFYHGTNLVGFTGLRINKIKVEGRRTLLIYFGQAVIESAYRNKNFLKRLSTLIGFKYFWQLLFAKGYCWCDTISFKSYLFFAKSMAEFYPSYKKNTPLQEEQVIYSIGETFYPDSFCALTGTVVKEQNYVTDISARITERHLKSPDIHFYALANPGYADGHGLITIVPMSLKNLTFILKRLWKQRKRKKINWPFFPAPSRLFYSNQTK